MPLVSVNVSAAAGAPEGAQFPAEFQPESVAPVQVRAVPAAEQVQALARAIKKIPLKKTDLPKLFFKNWMRGEFTASRPEIRMEIAALKWISPLFKMK